MTETMTRSESADDLGPERPRRSVLRGLSGAVTVCAVLLVLLVLAAQVYFQLRGYPGIGWGSVGVHAVAALLAVMLQRVADRRGGFTSALASLGVLATVAAVLWIFWWA
ncbi:hypothetical protein BC739_007265 [Kutzneria viridogrisea]|uniref:Uncharacterized protein n=2 Tax=Kutzneria TaxID=43356 RepID=W5W1E4_9PSEU|nr:hypothetical protein [Kutzneria albida]AHH94366.1 hypothetical protein KALB_993 [Kutzneria albida DSM 43870]MBA8930032.1 hypothetical protein [Kutzneria viridogrisea]